MSTQVTFTKKASMDLSVATIMALAKRRRYLSISVVSWVVIIILTAVVLVPAVQTILEIRDQLAVASEELDTKNQLISGLQGLDTQEIARMNLILSAALPIDKPVLPVLYSIDRLATDATVSLSNFQVSPGLLGTASAKLDSSAPGGSQVSAISPQIAALPLKMSVSGKFNNLSTFFQSLDNVVPFIQINSIQFATDATTKTASGSADYIAEVALSSLYLKNSVAKGEVKAVAPLSAKELTLLERLTKANEARLADTANTVAPTISTTSGLIFTDSQ